MGVDAKDVCVIVWKVLIFSTNTTCRYVRRYPVASGVSAFVILLYTFLPRVFYFMLCSSPLIVCASFYLRNHLSSKIGGSSVEEKRTDRGLSSISQEGRTDKAELKHQRSVRRNARREVEEVGKDWDSSLASEDERGKVIMTTLYGELPETITPDLEKFKRDRTLLVAEGSLFDSDFDSKGDVVVDPLEVLTSVCDGETEVECSSSSSSEEEEEEKESREDRDKVIVAWTEDDQKNLMDLGASEIERNKRLENLISRRRSRRLFLLAAERSLMDMEVPRVCIGRNYYGLDKENYEIDGLLMPGSAPSVLLPRRNPFDLPYDPQEEKPNLTGDSFHQEFAEANPKDAFFCRHESFHRRVFPSGLQKESKLTSSWRNDVDGSLKTLQDINDQPPVMKEREFTKGKGNDMDAGEVRMETGSIRNYDSDSNPTLSPREREKDFNVSDQSDASGTFSKRNGRVGNSLAGLVPRSGGSSSLATARQRYMEHFGYSTRQCHMVTHSVDSDLQVEVSELGSHPTSVDGNDSDEERSLFVYESEMGNEMGFNGDESEMLRVGKLDQDLNNTGSLASPEYEEARILEPMVPEPDEVSSKRPEELQKLPENSADEIKISYDSDEPESSKRTDQESGEPSERNDGEEMQQLAEAEAFDVNDHGNSEESDTSPRSVLPDMLHLDQTLSQDLDHISDGHLPDADPPAETSHNQLDEHIEPTVETTVEPVCLDSTGTSPEKPEGSEVTSNDESTSAEDHRPSSGPLSEELKNNQTDGN